MNTNILVTLGIVGAILLVLFSKTLKRAILSLFGGSIELPEAAGIVFTYLFIHMVMKEGNRTHEWHYYNELYIFFTGGAAMTGLGLNKVLDTVKEIRMGNAGNSTVTNTQIQKREVNNEAGE